MISNPDDGWCDFKLGEFVGRPSYLTGVPIDLLDCYFEYFWRGSSSVYFDEEGTKFTFVLSDAEVFIIRHGETPQLYKFDIFPEDLGVELLKDLEGNEQEWLDKFYMEPNESERVRLYNELINKVAILRNKLYQREFVDEESKLEVDYKYCTRKNVHQVMEGKEDDDKEYEAVADAFDEELDEVEYEWDEAEYELDEVDKLQ